MDNLSMKATVESLNYSTQISTPEPEIIKVQIDPTIILNDYAQSYRNELMRRNPERFQAAGLEADELQEYFNGLLHLRLQSVEGNCPDWRQAKQLWIPSIIQYVLTCVGVVWDVEKGLKFIPTCDENLSHNILKMLETSNKLALFKMDGLAMVKDAMPRSEEGDFDVMQCAIISDYITSTHRIGHPSASYIAALLGLKAEQAVVEGLLYRVRYDSVAYIKSMLQAETSLW